MAATTPDSELLAALTIEENTAWGEDNNDDTEMYEEMYENLSLPPPSPAPLHAVLSTAPFDPDSDSEPNDPPHPVSTRLLLTHFNVIQAHLILLTARTRDLLDSHATHMTIRRNQKRFLAALNLDSAAAYSQEAGRVRRGAAAVAGNLRVVLWYLDEVHMRVGYMRVHVVARRCRCCECHVQGDGYEREEGEEGGEEEGEGEEEEEEEDVEGIYKDMASWVALTIDKLSLIEKKLSAVKTWRENTAIFTSKMESEMASLVGERARK